MLLTVLLKLISCICQIKLPKLQKGKVFTHPIQGQHMKGWAHPSLFRFIAFPGAIPGLFRNPLTGAWEPHICTFCHSMCEVHDLIDMKFMCLYGDSNSDLLCEGYTRYQIGHSCHIFAIVYNLNVDLVFPTGTKIQALNTIPTTM